MFESYKTFDFHGVTGNKYYNLYETAINYKNQIFWNITKTKIYIFLIFLHWLVWNFNLYVFCKDKMFYGKRKKHKPTITQVFFGLTASSLFTQLDFFR